MAAKGAKYKWHEGKILHASYLWKSPTKRRIPRILIEDRALEVGIKMYLEEPWMVFEETTFDASEIDITDAESCEFYQGRYHLLPNMFANENTYILLQQGALLLWGIDKKYFVKSISR